MPVRLGRRPLSVTASLCFLEPIPIGRARIGILWGTSAATRGRVRSGGQPMDRGFSWQKNFCFCFKDGELLKTERFWSVWGRAPPAPLPCGPPMGPASCAWSWPLLGRLGSGPGRGVRKWPMKSKGFLFRSSLKKNSKNIKNRVLPVFGLAPLGPACHPVDQVNQGCVLSTGTTQYSVLSCYLRLHQRNGFSARHVFCPPQGGYPKCKPIP